MPGTLALLGFVGSSGNNGLLLGKVTQPRERHLSGAMGSSTPVGIFYASVFAHKVYASVALWGRTCYTSSAPARFRCPQQLIPWRASEAGNVIPLGQSSTPCRQAAERRIVAEAIRAIRLLFLGVECSREPFICLNGEDLCSTANSHNVEVYVDGCICSGTGAVGIHGVGPRVRHARAGCVAVEDDGIRKQETPRSVECRHSHSGITKGILSRHRMAGGVGAAQDKRIVACQSGVAALGVNSRCCRHDHSQSK